MVSSGADSGDGHVGDSLSKDALYELLSHRRRRAILYRLDEREGPVAFSDLSEAIAIGETDSDDAVPAETLQRVRISLHHVHVPKLSNADVVAFDRTERTVELLENGRAMLPHLEALDASA